MARSCMRVVLLALLPFTLVGALGCAAGFEGNGGDDDDQPSVDARLTTLDAAGADGRVIDAPASVIDAPASVIDAPTTAIDGGTTGGVCAVHADCGANACCNALLFICQAGAPLPLPPPLDCILPGQ